MERVRRERELRSVGRKRGAARQGCTEGEKVSREQERRGEVEARARAQREQRAKGSGCRERRGGNSGNDARRWS